VNSHSSLIDQLQLGDVLGTIPSGLFVVDLNMIVRYWNRAAERITGYSAEEAVGRHCSFLEGIPCGDSCGLYDEAVEKPVIGARCTIVKKSGQTVSLLKNIDYLRDGKGRIVGGVESFIDISRQKELEESLRQHAADLENRIEERTWELARSEARFRTVLDAMDDLAYISTQDFRLSFVNRAMRDQFGDILGGLCHAELYGFEAVCPWCPMERIRTNLTVRDERSFGPQRRIYEILHSPLQSDDGLIHKLAVCRDITERKAAEENLREANRELDAFAHTISHDLRGILSPVVTYMDYLGEQYGEVLDNQILQILGEVERQSERAIALLDDLLDLAQVGYVEPSGRMVALGKLVEEVETELRGAGLLGSHRLEVSDLPETWIPESLAYQVLVNLIRNACLYTDPKSGPIEIGCRLEGELNIYYVRDHGPGVSAEERKSIFEIFFRGQTAGQKRGTGVGLAIVRKIALRCQGNAWVEETPGGGATFCVSLSAQCPAAMAVSQ